MPNDQPSHSAIEIKFRAANPGSWHTSLLFAVGYVVVGIAIGLTVWLHAQRVLRDTLLARLSDAEHPAEALVAIEEAMQLSGDGATIVAVALVHPDPAVALAAYERLRAKVDQWMASGDEIARERCQSLLLQLKRLPTTPSPEARMHIGMLASHAMTVCEKKGPDWSDIAREFRSLMVPQDAGDLAIAEGGSDGEADTVERAEANAASSVAPAALQSPPPPLSRSDSEPPEVILAADTTSPSSGDSTPPADSFTAVSASIGDSSTSRGSPAQLPSHTRPIRSSPGTIASIADAGPDQLAGTRHAQERSGGSDELGRKNSHGATVYASSARPANSNDGNTDRSTPIVVGPGDAPLPPMVVHQAVSIEGIDQLPDDRLVRLLGSVQPRVNQAAALALKARGWPDADLELAVTLARGSEQLRLELLEQIIHRQDLNPRQWLLWMAADAQPEVRRAAVAMLGTMIDEEVERELRILLRRENDESVREAIRVSLLAARR